MSNKGFVYKIISPSGKIYIGQTVDFRNRVNQYSVLYCKSQPKLYNSLLKYGWDKHIIEILEECEISELSSKERYYQEFYNSVEEGLNCVYTTTSTKSGKLSEETKLKISKSNKGKKFSQEHISKLREKRKDRLFSDESKKKMSDSKKGKKSPWYGKKLSVETIQKMSNSMKGRKITEEVKQKLSVIMKSKSHTKKKVINTETKEIFNSVKEALSHVEFSYHSFCNMLSGRTVNKTNFIYYEPEIKS